MADTKVIRAVDTRNPTFARSLKSIKDQQLRQEIVATIQKLLLLDLDAAPAKLHLHQLTGKQVNSAIDSKKLVKVWTFHATRDDRYKCSFTFENDTAFLRLVDEHDRVDDYP